MPVAVYVALLHVISDNVGLSIMAGTRKLLGRERALQISYPRCTLLAFPPFHIVLPHSLHDDFQVLVPDATLCRALKTRDVDHTVLRARPDTALTISILCAPASVPMTTVDSATTASVALDTHDRDIRERQVVVILATGTSVKGVVRVRQL